MATPELNHSHPPQPNVREEVHRVFTDMIRDNPEYIHLLARKLWADLPPMERDAQQAIQRALTPEGDLELLAESTKAHIIINYVASQAELAEQLNNQFAETLPETPNAA
jgi:hypothetical protein